MSASGWPRQQSLTVGIAQMTSQPEATEMGLPGKQRFVLHLKKPQGIDGIPAAFRGERDACFDVRLVTSGKGSCPDQGAFR